MSDAPLSAEEELVKFLATSVPRPVPAKLRKSALRDSASAMLMAMGVVFLIMGLFFAKVFLPWRQLDEWRLDASHPESARGRIIAAAKTNMSINHRQVMRYDFEFATSQGAQMSGVGFTTGRRWSAGDVAEVRYDPAEPALACPAGARLSAGDLSSAFVLIFPLVGGGILFFSIRARRRTLWLLQNGTLGDFRVTAIQPTRVEINKQPQFKITLQRLDQADAQPHEVRWYKPALLAFARERQQNGQAIFGLFDPEKPKKVLLPEAWMQRG